MVKERPDNYRTTRMTDLPASDRPRERLAERGAQDLSTAELLAILLRVGVPGENAVQVGQRLLSDFKGLQGLHRASFEEVRRQHGIGEAKAAQIKAAIELGRRLLLEKPEERAAVHSPSDAAELVRYEMSALQQEHLRVILLDTRNQVIGVENVYIGSLNMAAARVGELFRAAIQRSAASIILVHNHPSGDPTPSPEDVAFTRSVIQAGRLLDIECLDHVVIGGMRFVSLKERGLAF